MKKHIFFPSVSSSVKGAACFNLLSRRLACLALFSILLMESGEAFAAGVQRMRISSGTHIIRPGGGGGGGGSRGFWSRFGGGGGGGSSSSSSLPASCIDLDRPAPNFTHSMDLAASSSIQVSRRKIGEESWEGPYPIGEVNGPQSKLPWFDLRGNDSATSLDIVPHNQEDQGYEYRFEVKNSKLAVFGERQVESGLSQDGTPVAKADDFVKSMATDPRTRLLQVVDTVDAALREATKGDPVFQAAFQESKAGGVDVEHLWLKGEKVMRTKVAVFLKGAIRQVLFHDARAGDSLQTSLGAEFAENFPDAETVAAIKASGERYHKVMSTLEPLLTKEQQKRLDFLKQAVAEADPAKFFERALAEGVAQTFRGLYFDEPSHVAQLNAPLQALGFDVRLFLSPQEQAPLEQASLLAFKSLASKLETLDDQTFRAKIVQQVDMARASFASGGEPPDANELGLVFRQAVLGDVQLLEKAETLFTARGWDLKEVVSTPPDELRTAATKLGKFTEGLTELGTDKDFKKRVESYQQRLREKFASNDVFPNLLGPELGQILRESAFEDPAILERADAFLAQWEGKPEDLGGWPAKGASRDTLVEKLSSARAGLGSLAEAFPQRGLFASGEIFYEEFRYQFGATGDINSTRAELRGALVVDDCLALPDPLTLMQLVPSLGGMIRSDAALSDKQRHALAAFCGLPAAPPLSPYAKYAFVRKDFLRDEWLLHTEPGEVHHVKDSPDLSAQLQQHLKGRTLVLDPLSESLEDLGIDAAGFTAPYESWDHFLGTMKRDSFVETSTRTAKKGSPAATEQRHINSDPADEMLVRMLKLPASAKGERGYGDAILVKFPDEHLMLVDTGNDLAALARIIDNVAQLHPGEKRVLDILITHDHTDHMKGLALLLKQMKKPDAGQNLVIGKVIFGVHKAEAKGVGEVLKQLGSLFKEDDISSDHLKVFNTRTPEALSRPLVELRDSFGSDGVNVTEIEGIRGASTRIIQLENPLSSNGSSLLLRIEHRGISRLLAGDLDFKSMETLVTSGVNIQADILKYPHHVSFPKTITKADKARLASFIQKVNPQFIEFSNYGSGMDATTEKKLKAFCIETLGHDVHFSSTNEVTPEGNEGPGFDQDRITETSTPSGGGLEITFFVAVHANQDG